MNNSFTARATRDEGWWTVTVNEVPGLFTQTRRLDQIPDMVRDALTLFPDTTENANGAEVTVVPEGPGLSLQAGWHSAISGACSGSATNRLASLPCLLRALTRQPVAWAPSCKWTRTSRTLPVRLSGIPDVGITHREVGG